MDGNKLGEHSGLHNFTVGQRRGIGISSTEPLYVIHKDTAANTVTVGPKDALGTTTIPLENLTLHRPVEQVTHVKLRYRSRPVPATVWRLPSAVCQLSEPFDGATPGQTAVFLRDNAVIGAATIAAPFNTVPVTLPLAPPAHV
jgi:tRNA-specific 2-thiouridylase